MYYQLGRSGVRDKVKGDETSLSSLAHSNGSLRLSHLFCSPKFCLRFSDDLFSKLFSRKKGSRFWIPRSWHSQFKKTCFFKQQFCYWEVS